jgi:hypothetical protein
VQNYGIILDFDLFLHGKTVDRVHGLWTAQGWVVHGGLATGTGRRAHRSAACRRCGARGSPRVGENGEELRGMLTEGFGGRIDGEARPAAVKGERRR